MSIEAQSTQQASEQDEVATLQAHTATALSGGTVVRSSLSDATGVNMHRDMAVLARVRRTGKPHIAPAPEAAVTGAWKVTVPNWNYGWTDTLAAGFIVMCADRANAIQEAGKCQPA